MHWVYFKKLTAIEPSAIKRLREIEPSFLKMSPDFIMARLPKIPMGLAEALCERRKMR